MKPAGVACSVCSCFPKASAMKSIEFLLVFRCLLQPCAMDDDNSTTTRLLTLLNVSAVKAGKRKWLYEDPVPSHKLNKRKSVQLSEDLSIAIIGTDGIVSRPNQPQEKHATTTTVNGNDSTKNDCMCDVHFSAA